MPTSCQSRKPRLVESASSSALPRSNGKTSVRPQPVYRVSILAKRNLYIRTALVTHKLNPALPNEEPSYDPAKTTYIAIFANEKARGYLSIDFHTMEETTKDILDDFKARGWL